MKNLILTGLVFATAISFSFAQLKVVAPDGDVNLGDISGIAATNLGKLNVGGKAFIESDLGVASRVLVGKGNVGQAIYDMFYDPAASFTSRLLSAKNPSGKLVTSFAHNGNGPFTLRTFNDNATISFIQSSGGSPVSRIFVDNSGKVGIGTTTPSAKLHVTGSAIKPGGGDWAAPSDKRLKHKIASFDKGLEAILKLNPVSYNYNGKGGITDTETTYVGVIAQEYQKIAPEAVSKYTHQNVELLDNESGAVAFKQGAVEEYLKVDGSQITYMLVNAIKEQQAIISDLQKAVENLKTSGGASTNFNSSNVLIQGGGEKALLAQNTPNPFTSNTKVEYYIPTTANSAVMSFTDISGKEIKRIPISQNGAGSLDVSIKEMPIGIYSYSLVVDGSTIATKKMVLSR